MSDPSKRIAQQARVLRFAIAACDGTTVFAWLSGLSLLAIGIFALVARAGLGYEHPAFVLSIAPMVVVVLLAAVVVAMKRCPKIETSLAILDEASRSGGLLMGSAHQGFDRWRASVRSHGVIPKVRWRWRRPAALFFTGFAMFIAGNFVPLAARASGLHLELTSYTNPLENKIETLEGMDVLSADEADEFDDRLHRIEERADAQRPAATWEALDRLAEELQQKSRQAAEQLGQASEVSSTIDSVAEVAASMAEQLPAEATQILKQEMKRAAKANDQLAANEELADALEQLASASRSGSHSDLAEAMKALQTAAGRCSGTSAERLALLAQIDPFAIPKKPQYRQDREAALAELRAMLESSCSSGQCDGEALAAALGMCFGYGINDGPGHVHLSWKEDPVSPDIASFALERVDSEPGDPTNSQVLATFAAAPPDDEAGIGSSGMALIADGSQQSGGSAARVLPRHRDAVRRFFDRAAQQNANETPSPSVNEPDPGQSNE